MGEIEIRWATIDDARGIAIVHVETWKAAYRGLVDDQLLESLTVDEREAGWSRRIASLAGHPSDSSSGTSHRLLVAEAGDRTIGWASFGAGRDEGMAHLGELSGLYVHPEYWSKQVGHVLITRVEKELLLAGWAEAFLWVLDGNDRAILFYEQHGWHADGTEKFVDTRGAHRLHEVRHRRRLR
ncbi:GNAT family N-acetyltransferase [Agreia pratensis]|uniref:GNAT family N-acetyltransferase n=1 Tax=Agreia pratensis TaxID=150121 RepID=UPI00188D2824|nr:GNAT family N-acetyltransferase [Agreia pratensis]MBF4634576.1 GNAT family N-acetyltransferase [Agreia pratensis]